MDQKEAQKQVVIGCGGRIPYDDDDGVKKIKPVTLPHIQVWNLETNEIMELMDDKFKCPEEDNDQDLEPTDNVDNIKDTPVNENGKFKELDDNYLVYTNANDGKVFLFTLAKGFESATTTENNNYGGDSFVAPRGTTKCGGCPEGTYGFDICIGIANILILPSTKGTKLFKKFLFVFQTAIVIKIILWVLHVMTWANVNVKQDLVETNVMSVMMDILVQIVINVILDITNPQDLQTV